MKRWTAILLALLMCLSLCACGGGSKDTADNTADASGEENNEILLDVGQTAKTDSFEITLTSVDFSNKVSLDAGDLLKAIPESSTSGLVAGDSQVYVILEMTVKNTAKEMQYAVDAFHKMAIDFADGYLYEYTDDNCVWLGSAVPMEGGFGIEPLAEEPYRIIIKCADDIVESNDALTLDFADTIDGNSVTVKFDLRTA